MAFKLKTGKGLNKLLAGAGIASLGAVLLGALAPTFAGSTMGKALTTAAAFGVGGFEAAAGAVATSFMGSGITSFTGPNAEGNVQVDSL